MISGQPLEALLQHDRWATRQILEACAKISKEDFHRPFEMGPGSLHATLVHICGAKRSWGALLAGTPQQTRLEQEGKRTPSELLALNDEISDAFDAAARGYPVEEEIHTERGGTKYTFVRGPVVTHVTTHGMHHRAQCLNMLRHLGVDPLPESSVLQWMLKRGSESS